MSQSKFAHITASLLARKGEAKPWQDLGKKSLSWHDNAPLPQAAATPEAPPPPFAEVRPSAVQQAPLHPHDIEFSDMSAAMAAAAVAPVGDQEKIKKCTIRMTLHDYERLGIIAVKQNVTRQHLLHDALDQFFAAATGQYRENCACLNEEACCQT